MTDRRSELVRMVRDADSALPGSQLAELLGVSTRSIRQFVSDINRSAGRMVIQSSHRGYVLDRSEHEVWAHGETFATGNGRGPRERLYFIARHLVSYSDVETDIYDLADTLYVSPATIEADLTRARELFRLHGLSIRRERELLSLEGDEREKRSLVKHLFLDAGRGFTPQMMREFVEAYRDYNLRVTSQEIQRSIMDLGWDIDEYSLNDVLVHVTIAADRVRLGHRIAVLNETNAQLPDALSAFTAELTKVVDENFGVVLPEAEAHRLTQLVASRVKRSGSTADPVELPPEIVTIVRDALRDVSEFYLLDLYDESAVRGIALHVWRLQERSSQGIQARNPLGETFKNSHPLVYEVALFFAERVEEKASVQIAADEVDFLAFHLGTQVQKQLEKGPLVTVTVVDVSPFASGHSRIVDSVASRLAGQGVVVDVVTALDFDWELISSDIVVSTIDLEGLVSVPTILVSPLMGEEDAERIEEIVKNRRKKVAKQRLRSRIAELIEPELFHSVDTISQHEALSLMCRKMVAAKAVSPGFLESVEGRERKSSTAFGGQFAIPHSMQADACRSAISVLVAGRGISWGESTVRIVVLFAVSSDDAQVFRDVLGEFIPVLSDPENLATLLESGERSECFVKSLSRILS
ncbi:BglG family transcription antiterminator [Paramicrobacterium chengjingii]|uniref:PTS sugar transporter subunit IIA n=1 Tax=Paramicrobacterium chengjingii TaxID=2769067 RepID=A0ABX6YHV0_9MICO|nr:PTS sugar transporter subunit IIA [Microbacterium chengjingii]QPZ38179.1 PTS sugar transporter subunit IIA [Microbacterium chengjingii]